MHFMILTEHGSTDLHMVTPLMCSMQSGDGILRLIHTTRGNDSWTFIFKCAVNLKAMKFEFWWTTAVKSIALVWKLCCLLYNSCNDGKWSVI